jgi:hypothetical protein
MLRNKKINIFWILSLLYMILIFILSSSHGSIINLSFSLSDKIVHVIEFGVLASLIYLALRDINTTKHHLFVLAFVITFLYGVSDEIHQYFVPGRRADIFDVIANGIGAFCFLTVIQMKTRFWSLARSPSTRPRVTRAGEIQKKIIRQD